LAGLVDLGMDLTDADVVIGTSAAGVVGAQITSGLPLGELYRAQLEATDERPVATGRRVRWLMAWAMLGSRDPARFRQRMGMLARSANTMSEAQRQARFQRRLPVHPLAAATAFAHCR
jgi:NTE family protein